FRQTTLVVVAVTSRRGGFVQVDRARIPCGNLNPFVTQTGNPANDVLEAVVGGRIAEKLGEKDRRPLDLGHGHGPAGEPTLERRFQTDAIVTAFGLECQVGSWQLDISTTGSVQRRAAGLIPAVSASLATAAPNLGAGAPADRSPVSPS